ncbi:MAG: Ppx/GppA phosphatase family protein [Candidatus Rokuibacteriota bacterium]
MARLSERRRPKRIALLELGSNAARFLLARVTPRDGFRVLREERVQTRLGGGPPGRLPRAAVDETVQAVRRFLSRARARERLRVVAVATAAVREAENREGLLRALRRDEGVRVRVLSERQEARLGALAALRSLPLMDGLVADLGGSSLHLTRLRNGRILSTRSVALGAIRTTRRFLRHDPPTSGEVRALRTWIRAALVESLPSARRGEEMVGLGGTVRALASIHQGTPAGGDASRHGLRLRQSHVTAIRERLQVLPKWERQRIPGLRAERADIILAGAIVIEEAMILGDYLTLVVCMRGVRDGLLFQATGNGKGL